MPKTEQRAFAAVSPEGKIAAHTIRPTAERVAMSPMYRRTAQANGWRIRPVLIRVEDETQETGYDR